MASPAVSRHTSGSNHIWKTSSGKSDLKSHFTVSQTLGGREEEGMDGREFAGLFTLRPRGVFRHVKLARPASLRGNEIWDCHRAGREREIENYKLLMAR